MNIKVAAFTVSEKSSNIIMHTVSDNITSTEILATITISQIRSLLYVSENNLHFLTMFTCFAIVAVIVVTKMILHECSGFIEFIKRVEKKR